MTGSQGETLMTEFAKRRGVLIGVIILGVVSLLCLVLYFLALTDIWHESGSQDFWQGEGVCAFEWRMLAICFWPMALFHLVGLAALIWVLRGPKTIGATNPKSD